MGLESIEKRVTEIAARTAGDRGLELVHVEVAGSDSANIIRVFIDKPDGVTHEDCSYVSHHLGTVLDVEDFIHTTYTLEVSSPGIERGLYKLTDYERFTGSRAKVKSRAAVNGQRNFRGQIIGVEGSDVVFDDVTNGRVRIPFDSISKAHLEVDLEEELHRAIGREGKAKRATGRGRKHD